ncbi:primary-amine oxidase [Reyranella sp. CPCC 100927]|uniref:primary-amine oxidase n=1 Tax=Reyranella sp. CPCC 100927 TaxID=2599616 RepID=UPI0011B41275|nr:primary-amine oxidase [Reyranella sp. CPCC 100927]TWS94117.1 primary-amine oxidase [Reyranella sp. CPCC 100927]
MSTVAEDIRTAETLDHPLDPLTPAEIRRAAAAVRKAHDLGTGMMFETITLHEPDKAAVQAFRPGARMAREAFVCAFDRSNGKVYEARVDLARDQVVDWRHVPGVRPRILVDDITLVGEVARADPRFRAALAKRGITDIEKVQVDPWSAGNYGLPDEAGRRLSHTFCWYRSEPNDNGYAHPIEGLCAVVDLDRAEVLRIDDYGAAPVPMGNRNYAARYRTTFRTDVKPLEIVQSQGPSFVVQGNEVRWQKWRLRIGFNGREGLVLHTIGYEDGGRLRPVLHRAALSEMVVPYGHPGGGHFRKNAFDVGEYGIGVLANSLTLGCDCLGAIRYFDAWLNDSKGDPYCIESAVCLHEEDAGILWKHTDLFTGEVDVRRARRLVVSSISTVGNYEYGQFWYFYQDGSIHFEIKATGILNTSGIRPGEKPDYGAMVSPGVYAHYHQHVFNMRLDMAVDGERNRVVEVDTVALPVGPDNPHGNAFTVRETVLASEQRAQRAVDFNAARLWKIESADRRNGLGQPTAYRLLPLNPVATFSSPQSMVARRAAFMTRQLWVTAFHPDEMHAAGRYPNQSAGGDGLPAWTAADRPLVDTDVVVWHSFGLHHLPRPEDFPVQPVVTSGFALHPAGFFDENPALDVPPAASTMSCCVD